MQQPEVWFQRSIADEEAVHLASELGLPLAIARILITRGIRTTDQANDFLHPSLGQLHDPLRMLGVSVAVARLHRAITAREPILIYGDYDVDGTVATVLLKTAIERAGAVLGIGVDVRYHIPHRVGEGYGMQDGRIAEAANEGVRVVVSVDTGIRAFSAAEEAKRVGLDLIVTDHHLPEAERDIPDAVCVINPNQPGCSYPYKALCGAGVAYKLAQALLEFVTPQEGHTRLWEKTLPSFLKLLSIATIADSVPLTGENRAIVAIGLRELRRPVQAGLQALMALAMIDTSHPIAASDIGFKLAPRVNAAGRMDIASDVVQLFLTRDVDEARALAAKLHRLNDDRRAAETEALESIDAQLERLRSASDGRSLPPCLVLDDSLVQTPWHRGVIGILASRVVDRTGRPALVITHEDGVAYGSGRSVPGFHLLDALTAVHHSGMKPLLTRFGGHAHAVGFALPSADTPLLRDRMIAFAVSNPTQTDSPFEYEYDAEVEISQISATFWASLEQLAPYGMENPEPAFLMRGIRLEKEPHVIKEKHLRLSFISKDGTCRLSGMAWARRTDWVALAEQQRWTQGSALDIIFRLRENRHPSFGGLEMEIQTARLATT